MWPRAVELMLGLWLTLGPFLFSHLDDRALTWSVELSGWTVVVLAALSFTRRFHRAHLGNIAVGLWLAAHGYFGYAHPAPPGAQNAILTGLTVLMIAIAPTDSTRPPASWRRFYGEQAAEDS